MCIIASLIYIGIDPRYKWVPWLVNGPGLALTTEDKG